jgi:hypothetical protein
MKTMKSVFAIFFSLLLLATQTAFMTPAACPTVQKHSAKNCCGSHCQRQCCVSKGDAPSPPSVPATQPVSQIDLQLLPASQLALDQSAADFSASVRPGSSVLLATAVPLYQRNCSYLV